MDVVIEAFACDPPAPFIERMVRQDSVWINLEYLSAEAWVESCHALPSVQANGLRKTFFRSEEHTSELESLMRISYAVFCLKKQQCIMLSTHTYTDNTPKLDTQ